MREGATPSVTGCHAWPGRCRVPGRRCSVWAKIPTAETAQDFAIRLLREAHVAVSPGSGFGADGEGNVRFALVENEQRIAQAVRGIRSAL
jgi:alanine-synthesizing transaminase